MTIVLLIVGVVVLGIALGRWWDEEQRQKQWLAAARKRLEEEEAEDFEAKWH